MSLRMDSSRTHLSSSEDGWGSWFERRNRTEKQLLFTLSIFAVLSLSLIIAVAVLASNRNSAKETDNIKPDKDGSTQVCTSTECVRAALLLMDTINETVDPCENFYAFSCDGWRATHKLPEDKGRYGAFDVLAKEISSSLRDLLTLPTTHDEPSAVTKAKRFFDSCLDEESMYSKTKDQVEIALADLGNWPIITDNWSEGGFNWLQNEAQFKNNPTLPGSDSSSFITLDVYFSENDTSINTIRFDQPSLGLGRDYLLKPLNYSTQITAYKLLIFKVAKFMDKNSQSNEIIEQQVAKMIELETKIAQLIMSPANRRAQRSHPSMTLGNFQNETGNEIDWLEYVKLVFKSIVNIDKNEVIYLMDQPYLYNLSALINQTDTRTLANYQLWRYILPLLLHISAETRSYIYDFVMVMSGVMKPPERWEVCLNEVDRAFPKAVGQIFVKTHFPADSKIQADEMIKEIQTAFIDNLKTIEWMDEATKKAAIDKAKNVIHNIGYPEWILDNAELDEYYEEVDVIAQDYFKSLKSAALAIATEELVSLREKPADRTKWYMSPNTVNAYYVPELNSITFPAGILQSPFYKAGRPMAMNFGGIGSVIGHEITHGFDDEGRKYDKTGALKSWWTQESINNFQNRSQCYVDQYKLYCPTELASTHTCINGNITLGENIADNGGLKAAFMAYKKWVQNNAREKSLPGLEQYSPDQLFFITFGQLWCSNWRKETLLNLILKDPHSPVEYRVIGTLTNSQEFATAFNCPQLNQKCQLW